MALSDVLAQKAPVAILRGFLAENRFPHALLLQGPAGVGKTTAALGVARALVCDGPAPRATGGAHEGRDDSCDACRPCRMVSRLAHPDVLVVVPTERDDSEDTEDIGPTLERIRKALDARLAAPFYEPQYPRAASIGIGVVRRYVQAELAKKPVEAPRRAVVVCEADRLTPAAQNALLKTLEEPPAFAHILLVTARPHALLDTVRSRCRVVRFGELARPVIAGLLRERLDAGDSEARLAAGLAGGSLPRAARLLGESLDVARADALAFVRAARRLDARAAAHVARTMISSDKPPASA